VPRCWPAALGARGSASLVAGGVEQVASSCRGVGQAARGGGWATGGGRAGGQRSAGRSLRSGGRRRVGLHCRRAAGGVQGFAAGGRPGARSCRGSRRAAGSGRSVPTRRLRAGSTDIGWGKVFFYIYGSGDLGEKDGCSAR
jgi:hypothetical protein